MDSTTQSSVVRLGTRGSLLARAQSQIVANELESRHRGLRVESIIIKTSGDLITDRPLHELGGKGLFTKELEQALLAGSVDFVVHSYKDVPVTMPLVEQADLIVACTPSRQDARDMLAAYGGVNSLHELAKGARVGTGSLRRRCQLTSLRPGPADFTAARQHRYPSSEAAGRRIRRDRACRRRHTSGRAL